MRNTGSSSTNHIQALLGTLIMNTYLWPFVYGRFFMNGLCSLLFENPWNTSNQATKAPLHPFSTTGWDEKQQQWPGWFSILRQWCSGTAGGSGEAPSLLPHSLSGVIFVLYTEKRGIFRGQWLLAGFLLQGVFVIGLIHTVKVSGKLPWASTNTNDGKLLVFKDLTSGYLCYKEH